MSQRERLYELLPAVHRVRDFEAGEPLRALLRALDAEFGRVEEDIAQLHENWFIETCQEWVVPYIGDLLRVRPIHAVESAGVTTRAYVANTLAYRRRKGTAVVLEQLARDATGWPAHAVEFFNRLATTQHLNHARHAPAATADIRDAARAELAGSAFDPFGHTAEVRNVDRARGRFNIPSVGLFLWRLQSYAVGRAGGAEPGDWATARERMDAAGRAIYTFHPAGLDAPLFNAPRTEETITQLATEENVPAPLRRLLLQRELELLRRAPAGGAAAGTAGVMGASDPAFRVRVQWSAGGAAEEVPRESIYLCEIPDGVELASPAPLAVAVDPSRGRLALPSGAAAHRVQVTYHYGAPGDIGGGPYDRTASVEALDLPADVWQAGVSHAGGAAPPLYASLRDAVAAWHDEPPGRTGIIALLDSATEVDAAGTLDIVVPAGSTLLVVAAGWPLEDDPPNPPRRSPGSLEPAGVRPHFVGDLAVTGLAAPAGAAAGRLLIDGLLLEGAVRVLDGRLGGLGVAHSTLLPPAGGLDVEAGNGMLRITLDRVITGPVRAAVPIDRITIRESIVAGDVGSPDLAVAAEGTAVAFDRVTLFGGVRAQVIDASDTLFTAPALAERRQSGCVRFSYVPTGSRIARRYRCQPDTAEAAAVAAAQATAQAAGSTLDGDAEAAIRGRLRARLVPAFVSRRYGDPGFGQLARRCPPELRRGGDGGGEMGAFGFLEEPKREDNLRTVLDEYLRFGLDAGVFFVTTDPGRERR